MKEASRSSIQAVRSNRSSSSEALPLIDVSGTSLGSRSTAVSHPDVRGFGSRIPDHVYARRLSASAGLPVDRDPSVDYPADGS